MVRQPKGLKHCKMIKRRAKKMWKASKCQPGLWDSCLRTAIEEHRLMVQSAIVAKNVEKQLSFSKALFVEGYCC